VPQCFTEHEASSATAKARAQANSVKGHRTGSLPMDLAGEILALQVMDATELGPPENRRVEPRQ